ncbi:8746_t:CDS:2 [Funneliformis mosseae]|uniref:8746_t:CDS:1 n=1 Tax=Funneliformis mosseae TaxID=27381 RepID=A0A9N9EZJ2_FUNMO|nr:8746_t:CDS:2 [Funneliformis mosseae]
MVWIKDTSKSFGFSKIAFQTGFGFSQTAFQTDMLIFLVWTSNGFLDQFQTL